MNYQTIVLLCGLMLRLTTSLAHQCCAQAQKNYSDLELLDTMHQQNDASQIIKDAHYFFKEYVDFQKSAQNITSSHAQELSNLVHQDSNYLKQLGYVHYHHCHDHSCPLFDKYGNEFFLLCVATLDDTALNSNTLHTNI